MEGVADDVFVRREAVRCGGGRVECFGVRAEVAVVRHKESPGFGGEGQEEVAVSLQEIEVSEIFTGLPSYFVEDQILGLTGECRHSKEDEKDRTLAGISKPVAGDLFTTDVRDGEFLLQFANE